jgi:hypothetical protein
MRDWQPRETAPKDGTSILIIGEPPLWKGYPFVVHWDQTLDDGEGWWRHTDPSLDALYAVSDSWTLWAHYPSPPEGGDHD